MDASSILSSASGLVRTLSVTESRAAGRAGQPLMAAARQLAQLNRQYLEILPAGELPEAVAAQVRKLPSDALLAMSDCYFSLFALGLDDSRRWLPLLQRAATEPTRYPADTQGVITRIEFVVNALFFAWHLAHTNSLAAKVLLELDDAIADALHAVPVTQLRALAVGAVDLLKPRFAQNQFYWSALVRNSADPAGAALQATKLLGRQLLAVESVGLLRGAEVAVGPRAPARSRPRVRK